MVGPLEEEEEAEEEEEKVEQEEKMFNSFRRLNTGHSNCVQNDLWIRIRIYERKRFNI